MQEIGSSVLHFSDDDVLREVLLVLAALEQHQLGLLDERRLLRQNVGVQLLRDVLVAVACLCDDEVKEHNARDDDNQQPDDPVDDVLVLLEEERLVEAEVAHGHTQSREHVTPEQADGRVLVARVLLAAAVFVAERSLDEAVTEAEDAKQQREEHDEDHVEDEEDAQVADNLREHRDDWRQGLEDAQEEEEGLE